MKQHTLPYILLTLLIAFLMGGTAVLALTERSSGNDGGEYTTNAPQAPQTCPATLRIMPLGDSITHGIGSTGAGTDPTYVGQGGGYREPLFTSLTTSGYTFDFVGKETSPDIPGFDNDSEGHPGFETQAFKGVITARLTNFPADVVLIHLGTNDISSNDPDPTIDLNDVLDDIDDYESTNSHVTVILAQIINRSCNVGLGACVTKISETSTYNDNIATLVQTRVTAGDDIRLINMEDDAGLDYTNNSTDFSDDLHPSNAGYAKMAAAWDSELDAYISGGCAGATPPTLPIITTTAGTTATAGQNYTYDVDATGDPTIIYSLPTAPIGMTINANSGLISWIPTNGQAGANNVTVQASNSGGSDTESFTIIVDAPPVIISSPATNALVGTEYSYQVQATGAPAPTYSLVAGPSGMGMDANGLVTWTPIGGQVGTHDVTVQATNSVDPDAQQIFTITVSSAPAAPIITSSPSTSAGPGATYSYQVQTTGYPQATYGLTVKPAGMSIDSDSGIITWTPGVSDTGSSVSVTVTATNSEGSDSQSFSIDVNYVVYLPLVVNP